MPLVSIIMNVRNGALYLREALDSVIAQTFADWELIVWDDCSTDDSAKVVREYSDKRIHYYLSPDETPLGEARKRAIREARGEWLAFLDQDDIWLPHKLQNQIMLIADGVGIIYGRTVLFDSTHGNLRDYDYFHEFGPLPEGDIFAKLFRQACFIAMSSVLLRSSAVTEVGEIPTEITLVPDYYLYVAIAQQYQARAVQQLVVRYRIHSDSMTVSAKHRLRLHQEPLQIVNQWAARVNPVVVAYRRMTLSTSLALEEMRNPQTALSGLQRLRQDGSLIWLLSRPFVRAWREVRRRVQQPCWRKQES
jgi:glycosyltransferase involved in cell wall biosynthesis